MTKELQRFSEAEARVATTKDVAELWKYYTLAEAFEDYARQHRKPDEEARAAYVKAIAGRRIGELSPSEQGKRTDLQPFPNGKRLDIPPKTMTEFRQLAAIPANLFALKIEDAKKGNRLVWHDLLKAARKYWKRARDKDAREAPAVPDSEHWMMLLGDALERYKELPANSADALITDPPYGRGFLPLFGKIPQMANHVLRPGGIVAVMSGQSYLPEVFAALAGLDYVWTMAYLTPGMETRIWARSIYTHWKPVLLFSKGDPALTWTMDLVVSPSADKQFHEWGQSIRGMTGLIDALTDPGDVVLDPFAGAAATGVACLSTGRKFIGIEIDDGHYKTARMRLHKAEHDDSAT